jgi:ankyrin repeat protein
LEQVSQKVANNRIESSFVPSGRETKLKSGRTLLHALCKSNTHRPVGIDILQSIVTAVPSALYIQDASRRQTPLHVAVGSRASIAVIECLLENDTTQQTVTMIDKNGDTPILLVAHDSDYEDMVNLLVKYDKSKQSLLIESNKRKRVPLFCVAVNEFRTTNENELSEELRFILLQTHQALLGNTPVDQEESQQSKESSTRAVENDDSSLEDDGCVLEATIACTHLLGKYASRLTAIILKNNFYHRERIFEPDAKGHLMLHRACVATAQYFENCLKLHGTHVDLIQCLMELNAASLKHCNARGELPLHLAIQTGKDWGHVDSLVRAYPDSFKHCNARGELPLHLAIKFGKDMRIARELWKHYPQAAAIVDGSTRLYPFQLVACHSQRAAPENNASSAHNKPPLGKHAEPTETESVDLIYFFLRESPQVLKQYTKR